ncbi:MAG: hypothetical protein HOW73_41085 [Polyangiaceae bacterium]|nr:hypothetical protein [Polyangiaceae bacterium]
MGCNGGNPPEALAPKASAVAPQNQSADATQSAEVPLPMSASAPVTDDGPPPGSPRPTAEEWAAAKDVNMAKVRRHPQCTIKGVREWLRIECVNVLRPIMRLTGLEKDKDYFESGAPLGANGFLDVLELRVDPGRVFITEGLQPTSLLYIARPSDEPAPTDVRLALATPGTSPVVTRPVEPIPEIRANETSKRPRDGDWEKGVSVNTADSKRQANECDLRVLGDWLRVRCGPLPGHVESGFGPGKGLGQKGRDFFESSEEYLELRVYVAELVIHLRRPMNALQIVDVVPWRTLKITWPADEPRPTEISLTKPEPGQTMAARAKLQEQFDE